MKKSLVILSLLMILGISFVYADYSHTMQMVDAPEYAGFSSDSRLNVPYYYQVTYNIQKAGWYLLPSRTFETVGPFKDGTDFQLFDSFDYVDYKYVFSPFNKKYFQCGKEGNLRNCGSSEDILGISKSLAESEKNLQTIYPYTLLSADWYYYSKPMTFVLEYKPYQLEKLATVKLKEGWNLIIVPGYLRTGQLKLGDCTLEKIYAFDDINQKWEEIMPNQLSEGIGTGVAIKVASDCSFLVFNDSQVQSPPQVPN